MWFNPRTPPFLPIAPSSMRRHCTTQCGVATESMVLGRARGGAGPDGLQPGPDGCTPNRVRGTLDHDEALEPTTRGSGHARGVAVLLYWLRRAPIHKVEGIA